MLLGVLVLIFGLIFIIFKNQIASFRYFRQSNIFMPSKKTGKRVAFGQQLKEYYGENKALKMIFYFGAILLVLGLIMIITSLMNVRIIS